MKFKAGYHTVKSEGYRQNNQYNRQNVNAALSYTLGKRSQTEVHAFGYFTTVYGEIPSSLNSDDFLSNPTLAASNWLGVEGNEDYLRQGVGLTKSHVTLSNWLFKLNHSVQSYQNDEVRPFNDLFEESTINTSRIDIRKEEVLGTPLKFEIGAEFMIEDSHWNTIQDGQTQDNLASVNSSFNVFTQVEYRIGGFRFLTGVNYFNGQNYIYDMINGPATSDNGRLRRYGIGDYFEQSIVSPNIKIGYNIKQQTMIYASFAHGYSVPTQDERFNSDGTANIEILPEDGWTIEVGAKKYEGKFQYDIAAYTMSLNNLLVPFRVSEERTIGVNAGSTSHFGLEASVNYEILFNKQKHLPSLSYTYGNYTLMTLK